MRRISPFFLLMLAACSNSGPENRPPTAVDQTASVDEDAILNGTVVASDPDGDQLTFAALTAPTNGTFTFSPDGAFFYRPDFNVSGTDSFTFRVTDSNGASATATVQIDILAVNDAPVAVDQMSDTNEDTIFNGTLAATDVDGDQLTFAALTSPANGSLSVSSAGTFTYQPNPDFYGADTFDFEVTDPSNARVIASYAISVLPVNDAPVASDQTLEILEDVFLNAPLAVIDVDGDALIYVITAAPQNGTTNISGGVLSYAPDANFYGSDLVRYQVSDGLVTSDAEVQINIVSVNDPPNAVIATNDYFLPAENVNLDGSSSTDVESTSLTFVWEQVSGPAVTLNNAASAQASFTAPSNASAIEIRLTVSDGELSDVQTMDVFVAKWSAVATTAEHVLALREDGSLWSWGNNDSGQLGTGLTNWELRPRLLDNDNVYIDVAAGSGTSFALQSDGTLLAFGLNVFGELGDGTTIDKPTPIVVLSGPYEDISVSGQFAIARKSNGTLWSWGINDPIPGMLGRPLEGVGGSPLIDPVPTQIGTNTSWTSIATSGNQTSALRSDNTLWSWGFNENGELGIGTTNPIGVTIDEGFPTQVGNRNDWTEVYRGRGGALFARSSDGLLWAAGNNTHGVLGIGSTGTVEPSLVQVGTDTDWLELCGGQRHTLAVKRNGTLWAWGANWFGERGLGDLQTEFAIPTQIGTDTDWAAVGCGGITSHAIKADGSLWSWGRNNAGQLGLGDTVDRLAPTIVD